MLRSIYYVFLSYRSLVAPILTVLAIVIPVWLAYRLYRLKSSGGRPSYPREMLQLVFVAYLAGLAATTLTPNRSPALIAAGGGGIQLRPNIPTLTCVSPSLPAGSRVQGFCMRNARGNVLLFLPLGFLLPLLWRGLSFWRGLQIGVAVSLTIELVQYFSGAWGGYRAADVNDLILNGVGTVLGLTAILLLRWLWLLGRRRDSAPEERGWE